MSHINYLLRFLVGSYIHGIAKLTKKSETSKAM